MNDFLVLIANNLQSSSNNQREYSFNLKCLPRAATPATETAGALC